MRNQAINTAQGHWILAKMGKKVLRPGGKELTEKLIQNLEITKDDDIVEFAPGLGYTASIALKKMPHTYTGIELNEEAASLLGRLINGLGKKIIIGNAADSTLEKASCHKVYGEAMLTMHANHRKSEIIKEAFRILKPGGLYGIHELGLKPDNISEQKKAEIQRELAHVIKVNARPLTQDEWSNLLKRKLNCAIGKKLFLRLAKYIQNYNLIIGLKIIISNFFYRAKAMFCFSRYALQSRLSIDIFSY